MTIFLAAAVGGVFTGIRARILTPNVGAWIADVDIDLPAVPVVPTGRVTLTIGTSVWSGTIDDRASGRRGLAARVRVTGGGGGWEKTLPAMHIHNDAGVTSALVIATTAASVLEVAQIAGVPTVYGPDYVRMAGPASSVLAGAPWYVNPQGITIVGPRIPFPMLPTTEILDWDPLLSVATISSVDPIAPGTLLVDTRFGTATVLDVEQTWTEEGARVKAWCTTNVVPAIPEGLPGGEPAPTAGTRLVRALAAVAREATDSRTLRAYKYRVVATGPDGRLTLASPRVGIGGPEPALLKAVEVWHGLPGATSKPLPGSVVRVAFLEGKPANPIVVGFGDDLQPLELSLDAIRVAIGAGTSPAARATELLAWATNITAWIVAAQALLPLLASLPPPAPISPSVASTKLWTE